jgi:hypothetical protein
MIEQQSVVDALFDDVNGANTRSEGWSWKLLSLMRLATAGTVCGINSFAPNGSRLINSSISERVLFCRSL